MMSVSNFTSATFAVVKKYTQLACVFIRKIGHHKNSLPRVVCVDFSWKSAILHTIYARVSAAMPVACTVPTVDKWYPFHKLNLELCIPLTSVNALLKICLNNETMKFSYIFTAINSSVSPIRPLNSLKW